MDKLYFTKILTLKGEILIIYNSLGLKSIRLMEDNLTKNLILKKYPELEERLKLYFKGERVEFKDFKINFLEFSSFQKRVYEAVRNISYGMTKSYKEITKEISHKKAYRAVGQALKRNPLPIIIPCHRVVGENRRIGGFSWGLSWKKYLLNLEHGKCWI